MPFENLDLKCAKIAEDAADKLEYSDQKLVSDASSILPKQGPYALTLYLESKRNPKKKPDETQKIDDLLAQIAATIKLADRETTVDGARNLARHIAQNPAQLLLARRLLLQFFAYLKYLLKAKAPEEDEPKDAQ